MAAKKKSFEESLQRLEEIVELMENGETGLEQSVKLYKEGVDISVFCAQKLKDVEQEVSLLQRTAAGAFEKRSFGMEDEDEL
jgi:exodeoxyribonuclease VII small subunit